MTTPTEPPEAQDFLVYLAAQAGGGTATELSDGLAELVRRVADRIGGGQLALGYVLERAGDVHRDAFGHVVQQVAADTEREVWHGTP